MKFDAKTAFFLLVIGVVAVIVGNKITDQIDQV